jgi:hypothetical protein
MRQTPRGARNNIMGTLQIGKIPFTTTRIRMQLFASLTKSLTQLLGADPKALIQAEHLKGIEGLHDLRKIWDLMPRLATPLYVRLNLPKQKNRRPE